MWHIEIHKILKSISILNTSGSRSIVFFVMRLGISSFGDRIVRGLTAFACHRFITVGMRNLLGIVSQQQGTSPCHVPSDTEGC